MVRLSILHCMTSDSAGTVEGYCPYAEEVRHASRNADSACPFLPSRQYKTGHAESAFRDACRTSSGPYGYVTHTINTAFVPQPLNASHLQLIEFTCGWLNCSHCEDSLGVAMRAVVQFWVRQVSWECQGMVLVPLLSSHTPDSLLLHHHPLQYRCHSSAHEFHYLHIADINLHPQHKLTVVS